MQAEDNQPGLGQTLGGDTFIATRGLECDHTAALDAADQLPHAGGAVGHGEGRARGMDMDIEPVHGNIDPDKGDDLWHASLSLACLTGSPKRPKQLFGLREAGRALLTTAV